MASGHPSISMSMDLMVRLRHALDGGTFEGILFGDTWDTRFNMVKRFAVRPAVGDGGKVESGQLPWQSFVSGQLREHGKMSDNSRPAPLGWFVVRTACLEPAVCF